jgi:NhaP-type Na+/H+ or K+/H+ antiporter
MTGVGLFVAVLLMYTLVSKRLAGTAVTPTLIFAVSGLIVGLAGGADIEPHALSSGAQEAVLLLAELALALVLFAGAATLGLRRLRAGTELPGRLLAIGLPLTIAAGVLAAVVLLGQLDIWETVLLAALLAPTDAALAGPVVSDHRIPARVRDALDVEAGLNDGVCVPIVTFALAATVAQEGSPVHGLAHEAMVIIGGGIVVGAVAGAIGGRLVALAMSRGTMAAAYEQMALAALAVGSFFAADAAGASGFIAAFVAGLLAAAPLGDRRRRLTEFMEQDGQLLSFAVFFIFGILTASLLDDLTWAVAGYAVLSLTVVRMAPVALSLIGTGLRLPTMAFMGWFGPRGIASIALLLVVIGEQHGLPGLGTIETTVVATVLLSIVVHAVSAPPLLARYAGTLRDRATAPIGPTSWAQDHGRVSTPSAKGE